ncbi:glycerophosphodiester phosphodiesterase family protein [Ancylomarina sp. YFZ004]
MKHLLTILIFVVHIQVSGACNQRINIEQSENFTNHIDGLCEIFNNSNDTYVMVVAHRGDWTNAPENSLQAIKNAIEIGVDIVEFDVRLTKDKIPVLMHDKTIDRTTTGKGKLSKWKLDALNKLFLTDINGKATTHKIPTLEEALTLSKGKILINLDKCTMHLDRIVEYLRKTNTQNQAIIRIRKDFYKTRLHKRCSKKDLIYIPKIKDNNNRLKHLSQKYIKANKPFAFDIDITKEDSYLIPCVKQIKDKSCRIWVSATEIENVRNYKHLAKNPSAETKWGWALKIGANIILTDEPALLIDYLEDKGLRKRKITGI